MLVVQTPTVQIWVCHDVEAQWHAQLAAEAEAQYWQWQEEVERDGDLDDQDTLHKREPEMFSARAATDPDWPPAELDPFEECERDPALVYA